ncbi:hypothetical protein EDF38_0031 [Frigoribacterium sp. PhB160]|uniref:hypothetical protein n=1 Tax=Frigoribacterium sp. PhB160 TaxID=2485192 RepID=UPI000FC13563|nr:hypothetical protein [Frigoribacterium sp. PhB160]ROS60955.1 hypothetical protein EDF38_0031 [Frigoribacterium sp. PhB160]
MKRNTFLKASVTIVAALSFFGASAAQAAPIPVDPDLTSPVLESLALASPATVGADDQIRLDFTIREKNALKAAIFYVEAPTGSLFQIRWDQNDDTATKTGDLWTGTATATVDGGIWPGGTYTPHSVNIYDQASNDGHVDFTAPGAITFPNITVVNASADLTAPILEGVKLASPATVGADDQIRLDFTIREKNALKAAIFYVEAPTGSLFQIRWDQNDDTATKTGDLWTGTATATVDGGIWPGGTYTPHSVNIYDQASNDGHVDFTAPGAITFPNITVVNASADLTAPILEGVKLASPATVGADDQIRLDFTIREKNALKAAIFYVEAPTGSLFQIRWDQNDDTATKTGDLWTGTATATVDGGIWPGGTYTPHSVNIYDQASNDGHVDFTAPGAITFPNISVVGVQPEPQPEPSEPGGEGPSPSAPVLEITSAPGPFTAGDDVDFQWAVTGLPQVASLDVDLEGPSGESRTLSYQVDGEPAGEGDVQRGLVTWRVDLSASPGIWTVTRFAAHNAEGGVTIRALGTESAPVTFLIDGGAIDRDPPEILAVAAPSEVAYGDDVRITWSVRDASHIGVAQVVVTTSDGGVYFFDSDPDELETTEDVTTGAVVVATGDRGLRPGDFTVVGMTLTDEHGFGGYVSFQEGGSPAPLPFRILERTPVSEGSEEGQGPGALSPADASVPPPATVEAASELAAPSLALAWTGTSPSTLAASLFGILALALGLVLVVLNRRRHRA